MTRTSGARCFTATAMPAMSPPPPTGTTIASSFGRGREHLERDRALARDDQRIVEGRHEPRAGLRGELLRVRERGRVVVTFEHDAARRDARCSRPS